MPSVLAVTVTEPAGREGDRPCARLDPQDLAAVGASVGDVVAVEGSRLTVARVERLPEEAWGRHVVQLDAIVSANAGTAAGERVRVRPVRCPPARSVVVRPLGDGPLRGVLRDNYLGLFLDGLPVARGDRVRAARVGGRFQEYRVEDVDADGGGPGTITGATRIEIGSAPEGPAEAAAVGYRDVGGLAEELLRVREMIELPLRHPEVFARLGIDPPKGVLLSGPPGCGKTLMARAVAAEAAAHLVHIDGPEVMHRLYGQSEANIRDRFDEARAMAPSILFIDEIDAIAPKREEVRGEVEKRVVAQLLASMDGLSGRGRVVVIAATNRPDALDPALRRPGRFDREIRVGVPGPEGRLEILRIHSRAMPLAPDVDLLRLAEATQGYVGADLASLCREAALAALRRALPDVLSRDDPVGPAELGRIAVHGEDFRQALAMVEPSALREVYTETPNVGWDQVGGLEEAKRTLEEAVEWPLRHAAAYESGGAAAARGVLLTGPPGTGKTLLARALARRCGVRLIPVSGPALLSRWLGETEKAIRAVFARARQVAPCIVFFDEVESLFPARAAPSAPPGAARAVGQLLAELDGLADPKGVVVLAATNRPDMLDPALLRPGRVDLVVELPLPDERARLEILRIHLAGRRTGEDVDLQALARRTEGFSGADLAALCGHAARLAVAESLRAAREPRAAGGPAAAEPAARVSAHRPGGTTAQPAADPAAGPAPVAARHVEQALGGLRHRYAALAPGRAVPQGAPG
jgi:transitional endoplasmic reticulum ATPase